MKKQNFKEYLEAIQGFDFEIPDKIIQDYADVAVELYRKFQVIEPSIDEQTFYNQLFPRTQGKLER